jgi:hypothetical protein
MTLMLTSHQQSFGQRLKLQREIYGRTRQQSSRSENN